MRDDVQRKLDNPQTYARYLHSLAFLATLKLGEREFTRPEVNQTRNMLSKTARGAAKHTDIVTPKMLNSAQPTSRSEWCRKTLQYHLTANALQPPEENLWDLPQRDALERVVDLAEALNVSADSLTRESEKIYLAASVDQAVDVFPGEQSMEILPENRHPDDAETGRPLDAKALLWYHTKGLTFAGQMQQSPWLGSYEKSLSDVRAGVMTPGVAEDVTSLNHLRATHASLVSDRVIRDKTGVRGYVSSMPSVPHSPTVQLYAALSERDPEGVKTLFDAVWRRGSPTIVPSTAEMREPAGVDDWLSRASAQLQITKPQLRH